MENPVLDWEFVNQSGKDNIFYGWLIDIAYWAMKENPISARDALVELSDGKLDMRLAFKYCGRANLRLRQEYEQRQKQEEQWREERRRELRLS